MKILIKSFLIISVLSFSACGEEFLELEPQQSLSISSAIVDLNSINAAVLGVYSNLQDANIYGWDLPLIPDLRGSNVYISSKNAGRFLNFDDFSNIDQCGFCTAEWSDMYETVVNSSNIINNFPNAEVLSSEQTEADNRLGEAHALRGLTYWNLVKMFALPYTADNGASAGIPLNNEGTDGNIITPARASVAEVYAQIVSDLERGIDLMTLETNGRLSKEGAQAILAKVHLYQENWSEVETLATAVINSGRYSLYADGDAWTNSWGANFGSEDIFTVVNTPADNIGVNSIGGIMDQDGYGDVLATEDLYNAYAETDVRRSVMIRGDRADGERDALFPEGKYPNGETGQDYIKVMRLADVYLMRAEARAELGNEEGAREDLDAVASRVNPSYVASTATGADLIDAILDERRREFAFEGDRSFDLTRRQKTWTKFTTFDSFEVTWNNPQLINPIPRAEIDNNPNITQNAGY